MFVEAEYERPTTPVVANGRLVYKVRRAGLSGRRSPATGRTVAP